MNTHSDAEKQSLHRLQDELLQLKAQLAFVSLKKGTSQTTAPFPIQVTARIATPVTASQYDVSSLTVVLTLGRAFLSSRADGLAVHAQSGELPSRLCHAVSDKLQHVWVDQVAQDNDWRLQQLLDYAQQHYLELLTLLPSVLEAYEAVNSAGATVRRYTFVDTPQDEQPANAQPTPPGLEPTKPAPAAAHLAPPPTATRPGGGSNAHVAAPQSAATRAARTSPAVAAAVGSTGPGPVTTRRTPPAATDDATAAAPGSAECCGAPGACVPVGSVHAPAAAAGHVPAGTLPHVGHTHAPAAAPGCTFAPAACPKRPPAPLQGAAQPVPPLAAEVAYMQRRFTSACTLRPVTAAGGAAFTLMLQPTDPAWPPRTPLLLQGHLQPAYPAPGSFSLQLPATSSLPRATQQALNTRLQELATELAGQATALRALLKTLENYASELARPTSSPAAVGGAVPVTSRAPGRTKEADRDGHAAQAGAASSGASSSSSAGWYSGSEGGSAPGSDFGSCDADDAHAAGPMPGAQQDDPRQQPPSAVAGGQCYQLALQGCELEGADALDAIRLVLQVACSRCGEPAAATLASRVVLDSLPPGSRAFEQLGSCTRCAQPWGASLRPEFVHSTSHVLGLLRAVGCVPRDLLPSVLGLQCAGCCETSALRAVQLGVPCGRRCGTCHERIGVRIAAAAFAPVAAPALPTGSGAPVCRRQGGGPGQRNGASAAGASHGLAGPHAVLAVGQALPGLGTCQHYRHSHRWLRFPCCGMRFPCDLCHEEGTDGHEMRFPCDLCHEEGTDGHEMRWATRMVCGYCSLEQPLGEQCAGCGKRLACAARQPAGRGTRFWEGGQGCRDARAMDNRDPHKWRNSRSKTKSAKHKRVGPKAVPREKDKA